MTNKERAALMEELRVYFDCKPHLFLLTNTAADQIEADGKRIAELEIEAQAQYHRGYYDARVADGKRIAELEARLVHAEGDCDDDCIYCDEWRMSRKGGVSDLGIGIVSPTTKLEVTYNRVALGETK